MKKRITCLLLTLVMLVSLIPTAAITAAADGLAISEAGIKVIKNYMGFKKNAYQVADGVYKIGYGTPSVAGATITEANADKYLREELAKLDGVVNSTITIPLVQKQHDALVWFSYVEGTSWTGNADFVMAVTNRDTGSDFVNAMCTSDYWYTGFTDDAANRSKVITRMAMANLYLNGVYNSANSGTFGFTIFDAGEGTFAGGSKKMIMAFDSNQITAIDIADPTCTGKQFLGWYNGSALVTGVGSATSGKTLTARWQAGADKVTALYTLPAYVIYQAAGIADTEELVVYKDPAILEKIDVVSRDSVVTVVAEKIYGTSKWLELSTGGWVEFATVGTTLPTIVPSVTVTITDDYVNIRKDPSVTSTKVGVAKRGETRVIVMTVGDAWGYCSEGWIYLAYTDYNGNASSGSVDLGSGTPGKVVGADLVNVRAAAGVGNTLVTRLARNTGVTVYEQTTVDGAAWGHIDEGWISMQYVQLKQTASSGSSAPTGSTVIVSSTVSLNIRSGPGTEYSKIGTLAPGTAVVVLQKQTVGGVSWALIDQGWINMNYVTAGGSASGSTGSGIGGTVVNCTNGVNIRSAAGTTNALVGVAALRSRVTVTERVLVNGHYWGHIDRGWVCMDYIQLDREFPENNGSTGTDNNDNVVTSFVGYPAVTKVDAEVRETASSDAKVVMTLKTGADVNITDRVIVGTNTFGKVTVGSITGWVNLTQVKLLPVNAKVTAAKADAYELPNVRSQFYASLVQGTYVTVGNEDGSGWELADGALWGQTKVTVSGVEHAAWIKLSDVTMFKENTLPTGITTLSGVGYLTGTINADTVVYRDSNGNVTSEATAYSLVKGHTVNIQARNYVSGTTYGKVTVGSVTGWIPMSNVTLEAVPMKASTDVKAFAAAADAVNLSATYKTVSAGDRFTVLERVLVPDTNEINHGIVDVGYGYLNDNPTDLWFIILDDGKMLPTSSAANDTPSNPSVVAGVVVTGKATAAISVYEDAITGSASLLTIQSGASVTVLNWKIVDGKVWGKVQVGQIVGWIDVSLLDFSGLNGTVAVEELPVYSRTDKDSSVQVLRVNNKIISIDPNLYFDGFILWGKITVADKTGWIDLSNVLLNTPGAIYTPELVIAKGIINSVAASAYLTEDPAGIAYAEVINLPKDTSVNLIDVKLNSGKVWWKVDLADKDGWVDMTFINLSSVTACITEASASIYNDLYTAGTAAGQTLYTMYRGETITVQGFALNGGNLFGQVAYGSTTGWILICDSVNAMKVSLTPGSSGTVIGGGSNGNPSAPGTPTEPTAPQGTAAYISCNSYVNVRSLPDPTSTLVTTLANGTPVTITEQTTYIGKGWAHIEQGWVCMDYVKLGTAPTTGTGTGTGSSSGSTTIMTTVPAGAIAVGYANEDVRIRSGSGLGYPQVGSVRKGNSIVIYENKLDGGMSWARTDSGWVCLSYFTVTGIGVSGSGSMGTIARCGFTANVRYTASSVGAQMAKVMVSSRVAVHEIQDNGGERWGLTDLGWISMEYIAMDSDSSAVAPTEPVITDGVTEVG